MIYVLLGAWPVLFLLGMRVGRVFERDEWTGCVAGIDDGSGRDDAYFRKAIRRQTASVRAKGWNADVP